MCQSNKQCTKCKEVKPATAFSRNKGRKDGLQSRCKECRKVAASPAGRADVAARKAKKAEMRGAGLKKCGRCKEVKPLTAFGRDKGRKDGLVSRCKDCCKSSRAKYRAENREKVMASHAKWAQSNPEKVKARGAKYRAENPEKVKASKAKWRAENPEKMKGYNHSRRARKQNAPGTFTAEQLKARFDYHGNRCVYCLCEGSMTLEHQIPLARGGSNWPSNLVPACGKCNYTKNDKTPSEFAEYRFGRFMRSFDKPRQATQSSSPRHPP